MFYRKKPITIQAFQITDWCMEDLNRTPYWFTNAIALDINANNSVTIKKDLGEWKIKINTLEGEYTVTKGWWIIKGIKGELYPCKDEIFINTYEKISNKNEIKYE